MLTIVTPNLNNASYLEGNILAIKGLVIPFEHIIVDGGSTDGSLDIIARYPHVKLVRQTEKTGMYGAIHQGIKEAKGEYLTYVNADDRIVPKGFERMYQEISKGKNNFVYSDGYYDYVLENRRELGKGRRWGKFFLKHGCMPSIQPSTIFTKKLYDEVGGLRYDKFRICGDFDLFLRMAKAANSKFRYLPVISTIFMKRGDSLGDRNDDVYIREFNANNLPRPTLLVKIFYRIFKYV